MKKVFDKKGGSYIATCCLILVVCLLLSFFLEYMSCYQAMKQIKDDVGIVLETTITKHGVDIYNAIKNNRTDSTGIVAGNVDFSSYEGNFQRYFFDQFTEFTGMTCDSNGVYRGEIDSHKIYIDNVEISISETNELSSTTDLNVNFVYHINVPMSFLGIKTNISSDVKIESHLKDKE